MGTWRLDTYTFWKIQISSKADLTRSRASASRYQARLVLMHTRRVSENAKVHNLIFLQ